MITGIILAVLIGIGIYLVNKSYDYDMLGGLMCVLFGIYLVVHLFALALVNYEYGMFVEKRNAFEQTLKLSRENGNDYETAAIVKEVAQWNIKLAERKYDNKTFVLDQYIDDRIETLEPIK